MKILKSCAKYGDGNVCPEIPNLKLLFLKNWLSRSYGICVSRALHSFFPVFSMCVHLLLHALHMLIHVMYSQNNFLFIFRHFVLYNMHFHSVFCYAIYFQFISGQYIYFLNSPVLYCFDHWMSIWYFFVYVLLLLRFLEIVFKHL